MIDTQQTKRLDTMTSEHVSGVSISTCQILPICAHAMQFAIELKYVNCVLPLMELQHAPSDLDYLSGWVNYRGKNLAVIDLGIWLGLGVTESYDLDAPVIVCSNGEVQLAFVVNEVMQVETVESHAIQMQDSFQKSNSPFVALIKLKSATVSLLDMPCILRKNFSVVDAFNPGLKHSSFSEFLTENN